MTTIEGQLVSLTVSPDEQVIGVTFLSRDSSLNEGRYMVRPENAFGGVTIDEKPVNTLGELLDWVMNPHGNFGCRVALTHYDGRAATVVEFSRVE